MNEGGFLFVRPLYDLVFNLLIIFYRLSGENLGIALILIAVVSRLVVYPFTKRQIQNAKNAKEFQKKYEKIKEKFKNNKEKQTQELAKLQGKYLPGQLAGCFTLILQFVLLIQINYVIRNLLQYGVEAFNHVAYPFVSQFPIDYQFHVTFLRVINLGLSAKDVGLTNFSKSYPYIVIALFLAGSQYFSMKILSGGNLEDSSKKKNDKKKDDEIPSFSEIFKDTNKQMFMFFPIIIAIFSLNYSSGLGLYFATTSLFVIIQQMILKKEELIKRFKEKFFIKDSNGIEIEKNGKRENKTKTATKQSKSKKKKKRKKNKKRK